MNIRMRLLLSGALIAMAAPAFAADLSTSSAAVVAPAPSAPIVNALTLEFSPEFDEKPTSTAKGQLVDSYIKAGLSHTFTGGWTWGGTLQYTAKDAPGGYQLQPETTLGYTVKIDPTFSVPLSAGLGYIANSAAGGSPAHDFAYYVFNAGLNVKLDSHWTWNAITARYRNAFIGKWVTPKVGTGVTYTIDPHNSVALSAGYAWQTTSNTNSAVVGNKWNVALGYKYGF